MLLRLHKHEIYIRHNNEQQFDIHNLRLQIYRHDLDDYDPHHILHDGLLRQENETFLIVYPSIRTCASFNEIYLVDNRAWIIRMSEGFVTQVISNSTLAVDTFFFISGFLLAYFYLEKSMGKTYTKSINYAAKLNEFFVVVTRRFIRYVVHYLNTPGQ